MKYELPANHGLSENALKRLVFHEADRPALSDVQHAALHAGVGRGESVLVVSPTSTGKTQIALWAITRSIESGHGTVYLVTHRALARQKFEDFKRQLLAPFLEGNGRSLVVATGDYVEDANGDFPNDPLSAPLLVATYEKYLALLSASGIPKTMRNKVIVCDEIQLIGDKHRGQSVEVLLTLLRNAGWKQFVGLSAVFQSDDARELANWLGVALVLEHAREKHLQYECWTDTQISSVSTDRPEVVRTSAAPTVQLDAISILLSLLGEKSPPVPIIVFCMRKQDTYDLARGFIEATDKGTKGQMSLAFDGLPETAANTFLARTLERRVASHNADLMDEEREIVEQHLLEGKLDVVFATTTLAAGVNFPLGAAVFADWRRWESDSRSYVPIDASEFHNMAGRVGRMGFAHEHGRVIYFATRVHQHHNASTYLQLGELPHIEPRIQPERFNQLALQLVASGLCNSRREVEGLACSTFSALREQDRNTTAFKRWPSLLNSAIDALLADTLLIETSAGRLAASPVGKAIGHSGLLPQSGVFLVNYLARHAVHLATLLPTATSSGDIFQLAFLLFSACLCSPEFRPHDGTPPTRFLPYPLSDLALFDADRFRDHLAEPVWHADPMPISAAWLCCDWMNGAEIRELEQRAQNLSAGMLRDLFRNLCWTLQGLSAICVASSDKTVPDLSRPKALRDAGDLLSAIAKLSRPVRRLAYRIDQGLPDDLLWLTSLCPPGSPYRLARHEMLALKARGISTPEQLMLGSAEADVARAAVFAKAKPTPQAKGNWIRDTARTWKSSQRKRVGERQIKRAERCARGDLVAKFHASKGTEFESTFEDVLQFLKIDFEKLDDKTKTGAPDYLLRIQDADPLIVELKSRGGDKLVDYNKAVEVLAASEVHGFRDAQCVTVCHPGVDPSVAMVIASCGRLCVVESVDLADALLRTCEGSMSHAQLWQWLATPGQAVASDLPLRDYGR